MITLFDSLRYNDIEIISLKSTDEEIAFYVENGKGILRENFVSSGENGVCSLEFDHIPLIHFHGSNYFCPTCEKMISAGYGLERCDERVKSLFESVNDPFVSLEQSFELLKALFGLLPSGFYSLSDLELFPTDGNGKFFWTVNNTPTINPATCTRYDSETFDWSLEQPKYILPSQPPSVFNRERADYYRDKRNLRAIAYYMMGYHCVLLDGHHKATAAALNGEPVRTLVISPGRRMTEYPSKSFRKKEYVEFQKISVLKSEMPRKLRRRFSDSQRSQENNELVSLDKEDSFDDYQWSADILEAVQNFYDVDILAAIEWTGDVENKRLDGILSGLEVIQLGEMRQIVRTLYGMKSSRFQEIAFFVGRNDLYKEIWYTVFSLLARKYDEKTEDYFVEFLVGNENNRTDLKKIVDKFFVDFYPN